MVCPQELKNILRIYQDIQCIHRRLKNNVFYCIIILIAIKLTEIKLI